MSVLYSQENTLRDAVDMILREWGKQYPYAVRFLNDNPARTTIEIRWGELPEHQRRPIYESEPVPSKVEGEGEGEAK